MDLWLGDCGHGTDDIFLEVESGTVRSAWTAIRHRGCILEPSTPLMRDRDQYKRQREDPRTFSDAISATDDAFPSYKEAQALKEGARYRPAELIVISDDEGGTFVVIDDGHPGT